VPCPLPRWIERVRLSITSPLARPSPNGRRVGIHIVTFEACSGFTHVTARRIAQPPKAAFVTRLQPNRLPGRAARQLPDQSTTLWVESSSTSDPRLRGALPTGDIDLLDRIIGEGKERNGSSLADYEGHRRVVRRCHHYRINSATRRSAAITAGSRRAARRANCAARCHRHDCHSSSRR
jgi:hypothetical protein